jgi:chromatin segregation and condensation protein Rec8/ScpA/Scc1 (kleisin family)
LPPPVVTVAEKIEEVLALLTEHGRIQVEDALATATSRFAVVVTFLAILELWHRRRIVVVQEQLFGPIEITLAPPPSEGTDKSAPIVSEFDTATQTS